MSSGVDVPESDYPKLAALKDAVYAVDRAGAIYRGDIHHVPWQLQPAQAEIDCNTMIRADLIGPSTTPILQFARTVDAIVWAPARIG